MVGITLRSRIGEKGQVVIPKPIRDQFSLTPFSDVVFAVENGRIVIQKKSSEEWLKNFGSSIKKIKLPSKIDWDSEYYSQFG
ncbi:MAG TPA: AbrB/MazE/SpoVT family DNA-binding domain-containing protein [archaeon]|nr:AbrB/MazE/SpoVT family DNA-binding domain-containing protein [archaeon]